MLDGPRDARVRIAYVTEDESKSPRVDETRDIPVRVVEYTERIGACNNAQTSEADLWDSDSICSVETLVSETVVAAVEPAENSENDTGANETLDAAAADVNDAEGDDGNADDEDDDEDDDDTDDSYSVDRDDDDDDGDDGNVAVVNDAGNDVNVDEDSIEKSNEGEERDDDDNAGGNDENVRRYREPLSSAISEPSYSPVSYHSDEDCMPHIPDAEKEEEWERILWEGNAEIPPELRIFPDSPVWGSSQELSYLNSTPEE
ncbi:serine-aspartate repeat-containing protein D-like [Odontomachus brunneus]|uniref:serine-aspartate repeat-containing protein D-like n=1 Tax=Odontomachus brunneus TaxID=486640 RepID=UPI0013F1BCDE|nr:serine-aspartate repeat-containing protein D-like [Odontomachus brunneus]